MALSGKNKENDNFEKMKREMTTKRQRAKKQDAIELPSSESKNKTHETPFNMKKAAQSEDDTFSELSTNAVMIDKSEDMEAEDEFKEVIAQPLHQDNAEDIGAETKKMEMVIFRIGDEEFASEISNVKEIIRLPSMTKVPGTPSFIAGLCSLRGELLPVIDSRKMFGMADADYNEGSRIVITDIQGEKVGLIADKVSEVISVEESAIMEPPESIKGIDGGVIKSILLLNDGKRVIMVLDVPKIVRAGKYADYSDLQDVHSVIQVQAEITLEEEQVIIFNIGNEEFAFSVNNVKEIIRMPDIMKVPNTPSYVEGVLSIRNQLLAVINLRSLLGVDCKQADEQSRIVIIENGNMSFGVIVDRVSQVTKVENDSLRMSSQAANTTEKDYVKGFLELNNGRRLIMLLDARKLISNEQVNSILSINDGRTAAESPSAVNTKIEADFEHVVIFKLGTSEFGIKINRVKEINRISEIVHFPGAPVFIDGMVNLRGEVLPVLNLNTMFHNDSSSSDYSKFLVVELNDKRIGIMIDSISEVLRISQNNLEEVSEVLCENENDKFIDAIAKLDEGKRIVLLLNLSEVLSFM